MGNKAQGYVLVIANWDFPLDGGSIFTTELTIMGLLFQYSYKNRVPHFRDLGARKFWQVGMIWGINLAFGWEYRDGL